MSEDITNLRLSEESTEIAKKLKDEDYFDDGLSAAKFAFAHALKYYFDELNTLAKLDSLNNLYDYNGSNYNVGSVDPDQYISSLMRLLYPEISTPFFYVRIIMCYGLNKIGEILDENRRTNLSKYM